MATCTPIFNLPVVEGSDDMCDVDEWSCAFATAVDSLLSGWDSVIDRTFTAVPMAGVRVETDATTPIPVSPPYVVFDTLDYDTDRIADLGDPKNIFTPNRDGFYVIEGSMYTRPVPEGTDPGQTITINAGGDTAVGDNTYSVVLDAYNSAASPAAVQYVTGRKYFQWTAAGSRYPVNASIGNIDNFAQFVSFSIYWIADIP